MAGRDLLDLVLTKIRVIDACILVSKNPNQLPGSQVLLPLSEYRLECYLVS